MRSLLLDLVQQDRDEIVMIEEDEYKLEEQLFDYLKAIDQSKTIL